MQSILHSANNIDRNVLDLVRPHLLSRKCLIVTGFHDLLSSLSIIMDELGQILRDPSMLPRPQIRLVYGIDTANKQHFPKGHTIKESIIRYYMSHHSLKIENTSDLKAVMAIEAIKRGEIDIHVFDRKLAKQLLGWRGRGKMHAKVISSDLGVVHGSANFSQSGLNYNIEWNEELKYDTDCSEIIKRAKSCAEFAENIFSASVECKEEVLEILRNLLRTVNPEDAVSRCIAEQTGFIYWQTAHYDNHGLAGVKNLFPYQSDLVYQAAGTIYDHGVAFVCAPAGSGKTPVGKYLAYILSETHRKTVSDGSMASTYRTGSLIISPPRIKKRWKKNDGKYKVLSYTDLSKKKHDQGMNSIAVHIVDESHQIAPGLKFVSNRARVVEDAPPAWTIFLSATQLGNRDVDGLIHFQEKRASLFMPDTFVNEIRGLFTESLHLLNSSDDGFDVLLDPLIDDNRLDHIREKLCEIISPYVVLCSRDNIGERTKNTSGKCGLYPVIKNHKRHKSLTFTNRERQKIDDLVNQIACISGDRPKIVRKFSRFGELDSHTFRDSALHARNLISLFRISPLVARYEMISGNLGNALRKIEHHKNQSKPTPLGQLEIFDDVLQEAARTPECDKLTQLFQSKVIDGLHQKCLNALLHIKKSHSKVVFLAERVLPLMVYAELLGQCDPDDDVYVIATKKDTSKSSNSDAIKAILGDIKKPSYTRKTEGRVIENLFSEDGIKRTSKSVSIFMTYQMAEGVNMQTCDTLVCISVASSMIHIIQGLGRIDRINSPFDKIHYYLVDIPTSPLTSDRNATKRLEMNRSITARTQTESQICVNPRDMTQNVFCGALDYIQSSRQLRNNNYYDLLSKILDLLDASTYTRIKEMVRDRSGIQGLWGTELAFLPSMKDTTIFHLKGSQESKSLDVLPPRLLAINSGKVERNQIQCAQILRDSYNKTVQLGLHKKEISLEAQEKALEQLISHVSQLREWDLRPERMLAPLATLAQVLGLDHPDNDNSPENLFGDLSLQALERLVENWTLILDPYWNKIKLKIRKDIKSGRVSPYASCEMAMQHAMQDFENRPCLISKMRELYNDQLASNRQDPSRIHSRIAVILISS